MLISFREAADLGFQVIIAVTAVACGMAITDVATKASLKPSKTIDVGRAALWVAGPVRIGRQSAVNAAGPMETASELASASCLDAIGLRVACDLPGAAPRRS